MLEELWRDVRADLNPDGSLRDVYAKSSRGTWTRFLTALSHSDYAQTTMVDGEPASTTLFSWEQVNDLRSTAHLMLQIQVGCCVLVNCHFFCEEEIELDIEPREIADLESFGAMVAFLKWFTAATATPAVLTHENCPQLPILSMSASGDVTVLTGHLGC